MSLKKNTTQEYLDSSKNQHFIAEGYLKEYLEKKKFYLLPKNLFWKNIIIFFHLKLFRKARIFFGFFFKVKFIFKNPSEYPIIIFDDVSSEIIERVLEEKNYYILRCRIENIRKIYLSLDIIFFIILNYSKRSLKLNYLIGLIKSINPKIVVTIIDNSIDFSIISKFFDENKVKFVALQNASRFKKELSKDFNYVPNYFSFGDFEIETIKNNNIKLPRLLAIGSTNAAVAKEYFLNNNYDLTKKKNDICLISEFHPFLNKEFANIKNVSKNITLAADYSLKFCAKYNKNIIFTGRSSNFLDLEGETIFYKNFIKDIDFKISLPDRSKFENYKNVVESELIIGTHSTMLLEAFTFGRKILWCNWVDEADFPCEGICVLNSKRQDDFNERVHEILKMDYQEYLSKIKNINLVYNLKANTLKLLREELK